MKALAIALLMLCVSQITVAQSSLPISNRRFKDQFLAVINAKRASGCNCGVTYMKPVAPLTWSDVLQTLHMSMRKICTAINTLATIAWTDGLWKIG